MGMDAAPKNNGVALKGELSQLYSPYDTDQDGAISPAETPNMPEAMLRFLLSDIIALKNDPDNNNHEAFIRALPAATIAKLFQKETSNEIPPLPNHIYGDFLARNPSNVAAVMHHLIAANSPDSADTFLKGVAAKEWKNVFMELTMLDPSNAAVHDYVSSRTKLDYAALQMRGEGLLEADKNRDGLLDAVEVKGMENLKTFPNPDLFKASSIFRKGHIPFHYLFEEMSPLLADLIILHAASGAKEGTDQSIDFLNNLAHQNTERFATVFVDMEKEVGAERARDLFRSVAGYLNENSRRDVEKIMADRSIFKEIPPGPAPSEIELLFLSKTPFAIEGLPSVNENNFEKEVKESLVPVLLVFGAEWCESCHKSIPTVKELAKEFEGRIKVAAVDYDRNSNLAKKMGIDKFPTFILLQRGNEMKRGRLKGFKPKELRRLLETNAPKIEKI